MLDAQVDHFEFSEKISLYGFFLLLGTWVNRSHVASRSGGFEHPWLSCFLVGFRRAFTMYVSLVILLLLESTWLRGELCP